MATPDLLVRNLALVPTAPANANVRPAVLTSWKDIARYMGKGVRTVQRWEQDFGLPVRRPYGSNKKAILARPEDLDAWVAMRCQSRVGVQLPDGRSSDRSDEQMRNRLSALNEQVQASRMLRESNRALMREIRDELSELRASIVSIAVNTNSRPGGLTPD